MKITMPKTVRTALALDILNAPVSPWIKSEEERANMTLACIDGAEIPRVKGAGSTKVVDGKTIQLMHNGLKVFQGGYQGEWAVKVIKGLNGLHEPQEEKVFYEVLKRVRPGGMMLELGSWWSYYSMWFLSEIKNAKAFCCEPDPDNLALGKSNAELNSFVIGEQIVFHQYAAGSQNNLQIDFETVKHETVRVPVRSIDSILEQESIDKLEILHMDIQGVELDALQGAIRSIDAGRVRFLFISTHHYSISGDPIMHQKCIEFIKEHGGEIIAKHSVLESCSGDGLIVASFDKIDSDFRVPITLQPTDDSLFRTAEEDLSILWNAHDQMYERFMELDSALQEERMELGRIKAQLAEITPLRRHIKESVRHRTKRAIRRLK